MTGRVIAGRYRLIEPIGRGAMGVVWRATDQLLDRDVAVKEVRLNPALGDVERDNAYKRTLREARTAARLSHRGVVTVFDVAEEGGRPWIIMELIRSRSLDDILGTDGPLPSRRAARVAQQLLSALAHAHAAGVLHRDVKPSNVLLSTGGYDERAVLTDFGIAQFEGDPRLTQTGMVMGSPGFTAPERIRGGSATPASDLWSLGATMFAACEGRGPYEARGGAITTMSAIINEDAPEATTAGPLGRVIGALLRRDPRRRPTALAAAGMIAEILPLLPDARPARTPTTLSPASGRTPLAATGVDVPKGTSPGSRGERPNPPAPHKSPDPPSPHKTSPPPPAPQPSAATPGAASPAAPAAGKDAARRPAGDSVKGAAPKPAEGAQAAQPGSSTDPAAAAAGSAGAIGAGAGRTGASSARTGSGSDPGAGARGARVASAAAASAAPASQAPAAEGRKAVPASQPAAASGQAAVAASDTAQDGDEGPDTAPYDTASDDNEAEGPDTAPYDTSADGNADDKTTDAASSDGLGSAPSEPAGDPVPQDDAAEGSPAESSAADNSAAHDGAADDSAADDNPAEGSAAEGSAAESSAADNSAADDASAAGSAADEAADAAPETGAQDSGSGPAEPARKAASADQAPAAAPGSGQGAETGPPGDGRTAPDLPVTVAPKVTAADGADQAAVRTIPDGKVLAAAIAAARQAGAGQAAETAQAAAAGDAAEAGMAEEQAVPADKAAPAAASFDTSLETAVRSKPKAAPPPTAWTTPRVTVKPQGPVAPMTAATTQAPQRNPSGPAQPAPAQPGPSQPGLSQPNAGAASNAWWDNAYQAQRPGSRSSGQYPPLPPQQGPASQSRVGQPGAWPSGSGTLEQPAFPEDQYPRGTGGTGGGTHPGGSPKRGRRLLLTLLVLVVVAAGAVAATTLLKHGTGSTPGTSGTTGVTTSPVASTGAVPPVTKNTPPVVIAIDKPSKGVPAGYQVAAFSPKQTGTTAGFTIDYPKGWHYQQDPQHPQRVTLTDTDRDRNIEIDLTPHQFPSDMLKEAQYIKSSAQQKGSFIRNYQQFELDAQDIRATRGGVWRFDYDNAQGTTIRADDLLFVLQTANGPQSYAIFATAPEGANSTFWNNNMLPVLEKILQTFEPTT